ncbi:P-loop containing nucleoside triphosphate hydrolase protein [Kalaharituber pfeilii]|nr:P-loop containing nucleoside triphosphate hydrolase protein [Kalaharituber pfeilii]
MIQGGTKRAGRRGKDKEAGDTSGGRQPRFKKAAFEATKKREVGVSDLTLLSKISNEAINDNLKKRFDIGEIYTYIGHVLISVNPFRDLGIYTDAVLESYKGKNRLEMPPHVYAVAESAYYNMNAYKDNQCIIISGESGAGKTEAAKRIMQYIANVSGSGSSSIQEIKDMVLATNPLLESFGCAKTLRNNNSSRHGKYLEIQFNAQGEPVGANITNYLLEKGRVVGQIEQERNFHIFYQFAKGASQKYRVPGIDDIADYADTLKAMNVIGLTQLEQDEIFRMLSIILWLGNVVFNEDEQGNAAIADPSVADFIAYLMGTDGAAVNKALTIRIMETSRGGRRGSVYDVPLNPTQAGAVRDALAKAIYNNLFEWIVSRVNISMTTRSAVAQTIGILDIYGFEIFERNSFEQICINYVNEKLQQIFIQLTLRTEQEEYAREQIQWTPIKYFDNKIVCDLIEEKRPPADGTFVQRLNMLSSNKHFENRQGQFLIRHYAGDVMYTVEGMTDKNKDQLLKDLLDLVEGSGNDFLHKLFPQQVDRDSKRRPPTASDKIKASANDLVNTLMKAQPSYIRTIKPNENKSPKEYNESAVLHQIKYLGLQENVRIRRAGFAYRQTFEKFVERFYLLSPKTSYAGDYTWTGDARSGAEVILKDTSIPKEEYQMGVTKAFIKTPETLFALEHMRDRYWHNMAIRIQRAWRNYLRYRAECATRIQRCWRRKKGGLEYLQLRDQGHQVLAGRKERRSMSLLGSRRFLGDYLGLGNDGGPGARVREAVKIGSETVLFSCRAQLLVSKLGRSSKQSPRILLLTNKAVYIIIQALIQGQLTIQAERHIPLGSLKFISLSNLRDDWMSIGVGSPQEPDPLVSCVFKTEFVTRLKNALHGTLDLRIGPTIEYAKRPGKMAAVKAIKDPSVPRDDLYKSGNIHVGPGEDPASVSKPTPKGKQIPGKPITAGKLLRPGGPGGKKSSYTPKPTPAVQPLPGHSQVQRERPKPSASVATATSGRAPPPPPPQPPVAIATEEPTYRALYDYTAQSANMLTIKKDEILIVVQKEDNGWWLAKKLSSPETQGWAPSAKREFERESGAPAPPAKRPNMTGKAKPALPSRNVTPIAVGQDRESTGSTNSLAGGLAEALRSRQIAMQGKKDDDDDDW